MSEETRKQWRVGYAPASWEELSKHLIGKGFSKEDIIESCMVLDTGVSSEVEQRTICECIAKKTGFTHYDGFERLKVSIGKYRDM